MWELNVTEIEVWEVFVLGAVVEVQHDLLDGTLPVLSRHLLADTQDIAERRIADGDLEGGIVLHSAVRLVFGFVFAIKGIPLPQSDKTDGRSCHVVVAPVAQLPGKIEESERLHLLADIADDGRWWTSKVCHFVLQWIWCAKKVMLF